MRVTRRSVASAAALALAVLVAAPASPASAQSAPAGGFADAAGIIVNLEALGGAIELPGVIEDTPIDPNTFAEASQSCPPQQPEPVTDTFLNVPAAPAATAATVSAMAGANCAEPVAVASAQTEDLNALINAGTPVISADVIRAQANSNCVDAPNAEGSVFTNLVVAGQAIGPNPAPNTRITIPGLATVIINEQNPTADGRGIVVNGLHIIGASPLLRGDLIISHAVSGVACPNGKGSEIAEGLQAPAITFDKDATPSTARAGDTVTYNATVTNTSQQPCDVIRFVDHLNPAFEFVSTSGGFGDAAVEPAPERADGGQDVVIDPEGVTIAAGASVNQTIVVRLKNDVQPGTYFNNLEIFCAVNGNFASGPIAPVTVPAQVVAAPPAPEPAPVELPRTGAAPLLALSALALIGGGLGARRFARR